MITQAEVVLLKLRELILSGAFPPGSHLMEIPLSKQLEVSRTPVRLALGALAQEGLLHYTAKSGFVVRGFSIKEIVDGVAVRGRLESLACRFVAERGLEPELEQALRENLEETAAIATVRRFDADCVRRWCDLNGVFHETLVAASGNATLGKFVQQTESIPLAAARTIAATLDNLDKINQVVTSSLGMHRLVLDAIARRQADRAERLMEEHVYQGQVGLRSYLESLEGSQRATAAGAIKLLAH